MQRRLSSFLNYFSTWAPEKRQYEFHTQARKFLSHHESFREICIIRLCGKLQMIPIITLIARNFWRFSHAVTLSATSSHCREAFFKGPCCCCSWFFFSITIRRRIHPSIYRPGFFLSAHTLSNKIGKLGVLLCERAQREIDNFSALLFCCFVRQLRRKKIWID